jgi:hypothetical protein
MAQIAYAINVTSLLPPERTIAAVPGGLSVVRHHWRPAALTRPTAMPSIAAPEPIIASRSNGHEITE